jgi:hypothetical protein
VRSVLLKLLLPCLLLLLLLLLQGWQAATSA